MIYYDYDSSAIISISLTSRDGTELLRIFKEVHKYLIDKGLKPQIHRLDNGASSNLLKK